MEVFALWFFGAIFLALIDAPNWLNAVTGLFLMAHWREQEKNRPWSETDKNWNT